MSCVWGGGTCVCGVSVWVVVCVNVVLCVGMCACVCGVGVCVVYVSVWRVCVCV